MTHASRRNAAEGLLGASGDNLAAEASVGASDPEASLTQVTDPATALLVEEIVRVWRGWDQTPSREGLAANLAAGDRALGELVGLTGVQVRVRLCDWRRAGLGYETCVRLLLARRP